MYLEQEIKQHLSQKVNKVYGVTFNYDFLNYCFVVTGEMNLPAYTSSFLCVGRTYDARNSKPGVDLIPLDDVSTKTIKKKFFTLNFKSIRNNQDCKKVLNISGDTSLKVKVGLLEAGGSAK